MLRYSTSVIPKPLLGVLWSALRLKVTEDVERLFHSEMLSDPSYEDFAAAVDCAPNDSAPGPSGLSYNMIKLWQDNMRRRVFGDLLDCWKRKSVPEYWKWRFLAPIPKDSTKESLGLVDLRPIVLVEALRKVWASIFVRRIQRLWKVHATLHPGQHGYLQGKGTDTAVVEVLNALETAKEYKSPFFMSSWDMKRAFDSVPKQLLIWSWVRLGVPPVLAEYLVEMDLSGHTLIRTPMAYRVLHERGRSEIQKRGLQFEADKGTGQGDIPSPLNWDAFFDILLTALDMVKGGEMFTQDKNFRIRPVQQAAYADDLVSIVGSREALQVMADIVSALCIFSEVSLSHGKFRAFAPNWGNAHRPGFSEGGVIVIHTGVWRSLCRWMARRCISA
jgi:hypothetical protein